jgi:hypothetical protein
MNTVCSVTRDRCPRLPAENMPFDPSPPTEPR